MTNIVGLDLNIDQDYLAQAVKQSVMMGIAESLNGKNEITSQIVNMVLNTRVNEKGVTSSYERDNKYSLLEYHVRNLVKDVFKEELAAVVEEKRELLRAKMKEELNKESNLDEFVNIFIKNTTKTLDSEWKTNIDISFERDDRDY